MPPTNPHAARTCANCRYQSLAPDRNMRCTYPRGVASLTATEPDRSCDDFRISFSAAKALAFENPAAQPQGLGEQWEEPMRRHLSARTKSFQLQS
ncbi:MAG: hypothetical protein JWL93_1815 [Hyphomicrobiales bacterium]|nr:hypothetical protein [Hyphomicrobiales bacterium]